MAMNAGKFVTDEEEMKRTPQTANVLQTLIEL